MVSFNTPILTHTFSFLDPKVVNINIPILTLVNLSSTTFLQHARGCIHNKLYLEILMFMCGPTIQLSFIFPIDSLYMAVLRLHLCRK